MSTTAPALGGASSSAAPTSSSSKRRSAWDPYAPLPPSAKRRVDPKDALEPRLFLQELAIPPEVAEERVAGKLLQLDLPEGKTSDWRKAELATREQEKEKKRVKRQREGDCGLSGKRKRASLGKRAVGSVHFDAVLPVYHLWLGYVSELLGVPLSVPPAAAVSPPDAPPDGLSARPELLATPLSTYPSKHAPQGPRESQINVVNLHTKLVKAEFVGCLLSVKRAKNPSLVGLKGIVLQETQGTFKLVTPQSQVKVVAKQGTVFNIILPLFSAAPASSRDLSLDLYGDSFAYRPADRVNKKWKAGTSMGGVELS